MARSDQSEATTLARLTAAQCLKNAHIHIATAYTQIDGKLDTPARRDRMVTETLDAVDWIRRALEHMSGARAVSDETQVGK
jgi:hypothetical protein